MTRKVLIFLFIVALIVSLNAVRGRINTENSADGVELIMDYGALQGLEGDIENVLLNLKEEGLTAVAIYPDTLRNLSGQGELFYLSGYELTKRDLETGMVNPELAQYPYDRKSAFIFIKNESIVERVIPFLPEWAERFKLEYHLQDGQAILFFKKWDNKFLELSLGFDRELIKKLTDYGFTVIPRLENSKISNDLYWSELAELSPDFVIFSGSEITGFDQEDPVGLRKTADIMHKEDITFGLIEPFIAKQAGAEALSYLIDFNLLRVHSIQQQEMDYREGYTIEAIVDRYLRAVRERNVRLLYLKPFLREKEELSPLEATRKFIGTLSSRLKNAGYHPGEASTFIKYRNTRLELLLLSLGIIIGGIFLLERFIDIKDNQIEWLYWALLILAVLVEVAILLGGRELFLRKLLALGSSVIFPTLAIITQLFNKEKQGLLIRFFKASAISLMGVLFLVASLAHISFMLQVAYFTGVKLSFILPVILVSLFYFLKKSGRKQWLKMVGTLLEKEVKVKHLILLMGLAIGGLIYIGRTGNNSIIPVLEIEVYLRGFLERVLAVRPRFKEFLLGHPLFIVALGLRDQLQSVLLFYPLVLLASIGQITIINTFSHIHTPLTISLIRVFHGLWLGTLIGTILLLLIRYLLSMVKRKKVGYND